MKSHREQCPECTTPLQSPSVECVECGWKASDEDVEPIKPSLPIFVPVTGGSFLMGSPSTEIGRDPDESIHETHVHPFWVSVVEVSQTLFKETMGINPSTHKHPLKPVESLTWFEAVDFCNKLSLLHNRQPAYSRGHTTNWDRTANGFRLPTEAEWEWMAKQKQHPAISQQQTQWQTQQTQPTKRKLQWVLGNVWEFCWDVYAPYPTDIETNMSTVPTNARVVRGGSWVDDAEILRPSNRGYVDPHNRTDTIGFRLVLSEPLSLVDSVQTIPNRL